MSAPTATCKRPSCENLFIVRDGKKYCSERCREYAGRARARARQSVPIEDAIRKNTEYVWGKLRKSSGYLGAVYHADPEATLELIVADMESVFAKFWEETVPSEDES